MPRRCIAAGCSTISGEGYSLHKFPLDDSLRAKWTRAVKLHRIGWKGPTASSLLCSKHFKPECFVTEGVRYCDAVGIPAQKRLKANAIPSIFPKSDGSQPTASSLRPASERRKRKAIVDEALHTSSALSDLHSATSLPALRSPSLDETVPMESHDNKQDNETTNIIPQSDVVRSIGIQCDLLAAPPLKKLQYKEDIIEEATHGETEKTDLHASHISQEDDTTDDNIDQSPSSFEPAQTVDEVIYTLKCI